LLIWEKKKKKGQKKQRWDKKCRKEGKKRPVFYAKLTLGHAMLIMVYPLVSEGKRNTLKDSVIKLDST